MPVARLELGCSTGACAGACDPVQGRGDPVVGAGLHSMGWGATLAPKCAPHSPPRQPSHHTRVGVSTHSHIVLFLISLGENPLFDATINIDGTNSLSPAEGALALSFIVIGQRAHRPRRTLVPFPAFRIDPTSREPHARRGVSRSDPLRASARRNTRQTQVYDK
eukprot:scaffold7099_cov131-Isochrysis_galbana.AAC.14